ncbi:vacuolar fusion protein MON1 homolog A-like isoform X1 [Homarus americanus]|uniref:vacuolar fusion protein MON1 homolog A-like isoform X1 n=1 Tax=Homarus americanus TaxID=6706 RepID=UPI001C4749BC|nr:vacuolar fusion protein MON1 homolog A-like isoform X1 [Homarus americanus]
MMADGVEDHLGVSSPKVTPGEAVGDELKDDTPGVSGEVMLVNTDSFEECHHELDTQFSGGEDGPVPNSPIRKVQQEQILTQENELVGGMGKVAVTEDEDKTDSEDRLQELVPSAAYVEEENLDEEYLQNPEWIRKEKHVFILSESGKPIYTRYGKEDRLVTLFGLMQALVSFVADSDDVIRCIVAGDHKFVFLVKSPLILVAVSHSVASIAQLLMQLTYVQNQIVSVLTASALTRMFEKRRNYDFRHLLGGTDRLLDNLLNMLDSHPSFLLGAIQCLPLATSVRDTITQTIIQYCSKIKNLVFGLIICQNQLISLVRMKKFLLHPADLHLLFNLVNATESLKTSENWMPICLPKFDPNGYLYGHVSYLADDCEACLLLLSVDREQFFTLSEAKQKIVDRLRRHHCLEGINTAIRTSFYTVKAIGAPELRHFLYKSKTTAQFTCPEYTAPYHTEAEQRRLFGLYQLLHHRVHSVSRPLKMVYMVMDTQTLLGWVTREFELYAALEPLVTKHNAIIYVNKLLRWIKSDENKLFILNSPTF